MGIFGESFIGNELWRWIVFGVVALVTVLASKSTTYLFSRIIPTITRRTQFRADDLILNVIRRPASLLILFSGLYYGLYFLRFDDTWVAELSAIKGIFYFVLTILIVYVIAGLYGDLLRHYLRPVVDGTETKLDDQLLPLAVKGGRFVIWALGLMIAFSNAGIDVTSLVAGLGIGGLALAMAAKDTVANVFGGASIFADRPFEIGDTIEVKGTTGEVIEIGVRTTRIRTFEDTVFILPNSVVADSPVENLSARRKRKKALSLGLTYDTTYAKLLEAKKILADVLAGFEGLEPDPIIRFDEFGASALILTVVYWVSDTAEYFSKAAEINEEILKRFEEAGIELAFPTQTLHLKQVA